MLSDSEKERRVDAWLADVSRASQRWKSAKAAQQSAERVVAYLEEISANVSPVPDELRERMVSAIEANRRNVGELADAALAQSELESGFYAVLQHVEPPEVAEAWRLRFVERKRWWQCANAVGYSRAHLERLGKRAKAQVYPHLPEAYRHG